VHDFDSFWLKGIAVKKEFQINQALRRSISEVQFCLSLQNLLRKFLLYKHCKEGSNCHNPFFGYSPNLIYFPNLQKKKRKRKKN
jgi:hypothetical protein